MGGRDLKPLLRTGDRVIGRVTSLNYQEVPFVRPISVWRGSFRYQGKSGNRDEELWLYGDFVVGETKVYIDGRLAWKSHREFGSLCVRLPRDTMGHIVEFQIEGRGVVGILGFFGIIEPVGKWVSRDSIQHEWDRRIASVLSNVFLSPYSGSSLRIDGRGRVWYVWKEENRLVSLLFVFFFLSLWNYREELGGKYLLGHILVMFLYGVIGFYLASGFKWRYGIELKSWVDVGYWGALVYLIRLLISFIVFKEEGVRSWLWRWGWRMELVYLIPFIYIGYSFVYQELLWLGWLMKGVVFGYVVKLINVYGEWAGRGEGGWFRYVLYLCALDLGVATFFYEF